MKRKVVKHGPSTFIISLPSRWVKEFNIQKGSELDVTEEGNKIIICTEDESKPLEASVNITGLDRTSIMYIIRSFYRRGYDTLKIQFDSPLTSYQREKKKINVVSVIHTEVNRLIGYEIIQEKDKLCVIKDIQVNSPKEFDSMLKRIFHLILDTYNDFLIGVRTHNIDLIETIEQKHDTITKFVSFCLRLLNKGDSSLSHNKTYYYNIITLLDKITDIVKYSSRDILVYNKPLNPKVIEIFEMVNVDLRNYYDLFYSYSKDMIAKINDNRYAAEKKLRELPDNLKTYEIIVASNNMMILEILVNFLETRTALEY